MTHEIELIIDLKNRTKNELDIIHEQLRELELRVKSLESRPYVWPPEPNFNCKTNWNDPVG